MTNEKRTPRQPSFIVALIPIVVMIALMLYCFLGGSESGYHDAHMPLVLSIIVACIVGVSCGHSFKEMLTGMIDRLERFHGSSSDPLHGWFPGIQLHGFRSDSVAYRIWT